MNSAPQTYKVYTLDNRKKIKIPTLAFKGLTPEGAIDMRDTLKGLYPESDFWTDPYLE